MKRQENMEFSYNSQRFTDSYVSLSREDDKLRRLAEIIIHNLSDHVIKK